MKIIELDKIIIPIERVVGMYIDPDNPKAIIICSEHNFSPKLSFQSEEETLNTFNMIKQALKDS